MLLDFLVALPLFLSWDPALAGFEPTTLEEVDWIPAIGVKYIFGVDGISMLLVQLTTLLGFIGALSSWSAIKERVKEYYVFLLLLQVGKLNKDVMLFPMFPSINIATP